MKNETKIEIILASGKEVTMYTPFSLGKVLVEIENTADARNSRNLLFSREGECIFIPHEIAKTSIFKTPSAS